MSNLIKHAERELSLIGYDGTDEYNNMAKDAIMELIKTFANQGHSGFSASYVSKIFSKLSKYQILSPLTGNDDEWVGVDEQFGIGKKLYQNNRDSRVFKDDSGCYCVDAIVWTDDGETSYTNGKSRMYIKSFPFTPKTFCVKVDNNDNVIDTDEYDRAKKYYENHE